MKVSKETQKSKLDQVPKTPVAENAQFAVPSIGYSKVEDNLEENKISNTTMDRQFDSMRILTQFEPMGILSQLDAPCTEINSPRIRVIEDSEFTPIPLDSDFPEYTLPPSTNSHDTTMTNPTTTDIIMPSIPVDITITHFKYLDNESFKLDETNSKKLMDLLNQNKSETLIFQDTDFSNTEACDLTAFLFPILNNQRHIKGLFFRNCHLSIIQIIELCKLLVTTSNIEYLKIEDNNYDNQSYQKHIPTFLILLSNSQLKKLELINNDFNTSVLEHLKIMSPLYPYKFSTMLEIDGYKKIFSLIQNSKTYCFPTLAKKSDPDKNIINKLEKLVEKQAQIFQDQNKREPRKENRNLNKNKISAIFKQHLEGLDDSKISSLLKKFTHLVNTPIIEMDNIVPIVWAIQNDALPIVNVLIDYNVSLNYHHLILALEKKNIDIFKKIFFTLQELNLIQNINKPIPDTRQVTLLLYAVVKDATHIVEFLLSKGADPVLTDSDGISPLKVAMQKGNSELVSLLLTALTIHQTNGVLHNKIVKQAAESLRTMLGIPQSTLGHQKAVTLLLNHFGGDLLKKHSIFTQIFTKTPLDLLISKKNDTKEKVVTTAIPVYNAINQIAENDAEVISRTNDILKNALELNQIKHIKQILNSYIASDNREDFSSVPRTLEFWSKLTSFRSPRHAIQSFLSKQKKLSDSNTNSTKDFKITDELLRELAQLILLNTQLPKYITDQEKTELKNLFQETLLELFNLQKTKGSSVTGLQPEITANQDILALIDIAIKINNLFDKPLFNYSELLRQIIVPVIVNTWKDKTLLIISKNMLSDKELQDRVPSCLSNKDLTNLDKIILNTQDQNELKLFIIKADKWFNSLYKRTENLEKQVILKKNISNNSTKINP